MKLLPDSNTFITYWQNYNGLAEKYEDVFKKEEIVVCGVVRAELLHGAVSEKHMRSMITMFDAFESCDLTGSDWNVLGGQLYKLRTNGVTVPLADAIIASASIKYSIPVWTSDKHFTLIQGVFPELKLYLA